MTKFPVNSFSGYWATALVMALASIPAPARATESLTDQIDRAVDKALAFLISSQAKDGTWEPPARQPPVAVDPQLGGKTALAMAALLTAGKSDRDRDLTRALDWLTEQDLHGTSAVAFRCQVWNHILWRMTKPMKAARDRDKDFLFLSRIRTGPNKGFYGAGYDGQAANAPAGTPPRQNGVLMFPGLNPNGPPEDALCNLNDSQAAVYAAWAAEKADAEVPTQYWIDEDSAWKKAQKLDGGWNLGPDDKKDANLKMTCNGVSTLLITQGYLLRIAARQFDACKGGSSAPELKKGMAWIDRHAAEALKADAGPDFETLYAISRVGWGSGHKYLGGIDWYRRGAEILVKSQAADGGWGSVHDTSYAILFLVEGRTMGMMNKLEYALPKSTQNEPWNERPLDVANFVNWAGPHALCATHAVWHAVRLSDSIDEMHDAPILYIAGSESLEFNDADLARLRTFVEDGGMILGNADCGSKAFVDSFIKLGKTLFPKYDFRKLPESHPIFDEQYHAARWKKRPQLQGISNGVRELMVILPDTDLALSWQNGLTKTREEHFQLAVNIFEYAAGEKWLRGTDVPYTIVRPHGPVVREIKVARLIIGNNPDPEPAAWQRLAALFRNDRQIALKAEPIPLGKGKLANYKIAALTGTGPLKLGPAEIEEIRQFVDNGGTIIIDAAGGREEFADSAQTMLAQAFGQDAGKTLEEPLVEDAEFYRHAKLDRIMYRRFARRTLAGRAHDGRIRAITVPSGRIGVFFSREDITAGLVGEEVDGIVGYSPETAMQLMTQMILYAADGEKK